MAKLNQKTVNLILDTIRAMASSTSYKDERGLRVARLPAVSSLQRAVSDRTKMPIGTTVQYLSWLIQRGYLEPGARGRGRTARWVVMEGYPKV